MKLKFKQQEFQSIAVQAICDLFTGQHKRTDTFTITNETQLQLEEGIGIRNVLDLSNEQITAKEWLLSFDCPLRFIFSHSALKEGWDNPNVFQVCTLIEQKSTFTARQKVGRGLRLCVNQEGERIEDRNINVLHVMANESFAEFADNLQKEIEQETGVKFGVLQLSLFNGLTFTTSVTEEKTVSEEQARVIADYVAALVAPKPEAAPSADPEKYSAL